MSSPTKLITLSWRANRREVREKRATTDKMARIICGSILTWNGPEMVITDLAIDGVAFAG
jgi:hypothetical protein